MFLFTTMGMGWEWEYGHGYVREWDQKSPSCTSLILTNKILGQHAQISRDVLKMHATYGRESLV